MCNNNCLVFYNLNNYFMDAIEAQRESLLRIKQALKKTFGAETVKNVGEVFILSNALPYRFDDQVYNAHMRDSSLVYFSVLSLNPAIYAGEKKYADALKATFGGIVRQTEYRHIAEWTWKLDGLSSQLDEKKAFEAMFNVV